MTQAALAIADLADRDFAPRVPPRRFADAASHMNRITQVHSKP